MFNIKSKIWTILNSFTEEIFAIGWFWKDLRKKFLWSLRFETGEEILLIAVKIAKINPTKVSSVKIFPLRYLKHTLIFGVSHWKSWLFKKIFATDQFWNIKIGVKIAKLNPAKISSVKLFSFKVPHFWSYSFEILAVLKFFLQFISFETLK